MAKIESDLLSKLPRQTLKGTDISNLTYKMYGGGWEKLPVFKELKPEREGKLAAGLFDISISGRAQRFAFVFSGELNVPRTGKYTFYLNSDDGTRLFVGGKKIAEWDGIHGMGKPQVGTISLRRGRVPIVLEYFQNEGGLGLIVEWKGPVAAKRALSVTGGVSVKLSRLMKEQGPKLLGAKTVGEYNRLQKELRAKAKAPKGDVALCVSEPNRVQETYVLRRGNPRLKGRQVEPGFPSVLGFKDPVFPANPTGKTTGRRTVLAKWIVRPDNQLTSRAMANRLWQYHFGRGIVPTSNDFGKLGRMPTHPGLLNWLASEFVSGKWKIKRMHRILMTSNTYRMSSKDSSASLVKDPENTLFWRFNMRRLTAEEIRDSILQVNGTLNLKMGGPSVFPPVPSAVLATKIRKNAQRRRRGVHGQVRRYPPLEHHAGYSGAGHPQ